MKTSTQVLMAVVALALAGCADVRSGTAATDTAVAVAPPVQDPVAIGPNVDWNAPVVDGITVSATQAQQVAKARIPLRLPALPARLAKIQATDPLKYPEDARGYGVLFDFPSSAAFPEGGKLLVEQQPATPEDPQMVRNIAHNGPGYRLGNILGVEVAFIQASERASATFVHQGIRFNINGPALPMQVVEAATTAVITASSQP